MAFNVGDQVRVADQSSEYRGKSGDVMAVSDDNHEVRLYGHGCSDRVTLRTDQLRADSRTTGDAALDYSRC